jgi:lipopolysaccharide/colanic/teichoic acid biosynthesis glycosyltransferase
MSAAASPRAGLVTATGNLALCLLAWSAMPAAFPAADADWKFVIPISAVASWLAVTAFQYRDSGVNSWIDQLFYSAGLNMLLEYGLAYAFLFRPAPLEAMVASVCLSTILVAACARWAFPRGEGESPGILFLGYDSTARALTPIYGSRVVGVLDDGVALLPAGVRSLGSPDDLEKVVAEAGPGWVVVAGRPPGARRLLDLQYSGSAVVEGSALHETLLGRVRWDRLRPLDLLFSRSTNADRFGMAVQAVYNNLAGLTLLLAVTPLLMVLGALVALASNGGPVFEFTECLGFQMIPFRLMRFSQGRPGEPPHAAGRLLSKLHLIDLPRLINVVRGEMALFGPPPVRAEFAERLSRFIPVYAHRFTIKPGLTGWSQVHLPLSKGVADEALRLEYDLYYVKQNSVSLDLEILMRAILPGRAGSRQAGVH